jgi:(4S)-4-hydroxy-5-phosphonooxypentane-2,3-dione isomerase
MEDGFMLVVLVYSHVKPEVINLYKLASLENATQSVNEPGIVRFDVIQQIDDPTRFVLIEVYRTKDALEKHRETSHYQKWRETVEPMMAEPRSRSQYTNVYPDDIGWG